MNLNELREAMASDATKENAELKQKLKKLQKRYERETSKLYERIEALTTDCRALGNRCFVYTRGGMCVFCNLHSGECDHMMSFDETVKVAEKLRREYEKQEG